MMFSVLFIELHKPLIIKQNAKYFSETKAFLNSKMLVESKSKLDHIIDDDIYLKTVRVYLKQCQYTEIICLLLSSKDLFRQIGAKAEQRAE